MRRVIWHSWAPTQALLFAAQFSHTVAKSRVLPEPPTNWSHVFLFTGKPGLMGASSSS